MEFDWKSAEHVAFDADVLAAMLAAVETQCREPTLVLETDGTVSARAVSADHVTMVDVTAPRLLEGDLTARRFGIDTKEWLNILRRHRGRASMDLLPGAVRITCGMYDIVVRPTEPEDPAKLPGIRLETVCMLEPKLLQGFVSMVDRRTSAYWTVSLGPDGMTVGVRDDTGTGPGMTVPASALDLLEVPGDAVRASYPWSRWADMIGALPDAPVGLEMEDACPCRLTFGGENWSGQWLCAPVIREAE